MDGLLNLIERAARVVEAGERVAEKDVRVRALRARLQRSLGQGPRLAIVARDEQQRAGFDVRIGVRRVEVRGAHERLIGFLRFVGLQIDAAKLDSAPRPGRALP